MYDGTSDATISKEGRRSPDHRHKADSRAPATTIGNTFRSARSIDKTSTPSEDMSTQNSSTSTAAQPIVSRQLIQEPVELSYSESPIGLGLLPPCAKCGSRRCGVSCTDCTGSGRRMVLGAETVEDQVCGTCDGSGKKPCQTKPKTPPAESMDVC